MGQRKKVTIIIAVIVGAIMLSAGAAVLSRYIECRSEERLIYYNGIQYRYRDDISTFLEASHNLYMTITLSP